jgi:hypothetical protein
MDKYDSEISADIISLPIFGKTCILIANYYWSMTNDKISFVPSHLSYLYYAA